jgi:hypothetical protein
MDNFEELLKELNLMKDDIAKSKSSEERIVRILLEISCDLKKIRINTIRGR